MNCSTCRHSTISETASGNLCVGCSQEGYEQIFICTPQEMEEFTCDVWEDIDVWKQQRKIRKAAAKLMKTSSALACVDIKGDGFRIHIDREPIKCKQAEQSKP